MSNNVKLNRPELKMTNKGKLEQPTTALRRMEHLWGKNFPSETCFDCQFYVRRQTCQIIDKKGGSSLAYQITRKGVLLDLERNLSSYLMGMY